MDTWCKTVVRLDIMGSIIELKDLRCGEGNTRSERTDSNSQTGHREVGELT